MAVNIKFLNENATSVSEQAISEINFGNVIRGNSNEVGFKIGNTGDSIAESVTIKIEGSSQAVSWKQLSKDNGSSWSSEIAIDDIPALTGLSGKIKIKTTVPSSASTGAYNSVVRVEYIYI